MYKPHLRFISATILFVFVLQLQAYAQKAKSAQQTRPKLAVVIIIDQFRQDYLSRFHHLFGPRGFKRLLSGANFKNAHYPYSNTETAVGHASIATGGLPSSHGIIANKWYDRELGEVKESVYDEKMAREGKDYPASPYKLLASTLAEQLRLSNNYKSRAYGISLKDRSAILTTGNAGNAAFWFDAKTGRMVTSPHYMNSLPAWVEQFNQRKLPDSYFGKLWEKSRPESVYSVSDDDNAPYERSWASDAPAVFPHRIAGKNNLIDYSFYEQLKGTPYGNDYLLEFTKAILKEERLGHHDYPDMLTVSFSSLDLCGHASGPYSQEVQDIVLRLDATIAELLDTIDKHVGLANTIIAFTSDHGVAPSPGYSNRYHLKGGRIDAAEVTEFIEKSLVSRYGEGKYVLSFVNSQFYLNTELIEKKGLNRAEVEDFIGQQSLKILGIANYYTRSRLLMNLAQDGTPISKRVQAGFHAKRSGDVVLVAEPFFLIAESEEEKLGTDHGTPYHYDTHVPIILFGYGVKPGEYSLSASPTDIAPTLAYLLNIEAPNCSTGRILTEAMK